jgi:hypothetical protein
MTHKTDQSHVTFQLKMPAELHRRLKIAAASRRQTLQVLIVQILEAKRFEVGKT